MSYVSRGYVYRERVIEDLEDNYESVMSVIDNSGRYGLAWTLDDYQDTYVFMPIDDTKHNNSFDEDWIYVEKKFKSDLEEINETLREEARQVSVKCLLK